MVVCQGLQVILMQCGENIATWLCERHRVPWQCLQTGDPNTIHHHVTLSPFPLSPSAFWSPFRFASHRATTASKSSNSSLMPNWSCIIPLSTAVASAARPERDPSGRRGLRPSEMIVLKQADAQIGEQSESASFEAENCLGLIELTPGYTTISGRNFFSVRLESNPWQSYYRLAANLGSYTRSYAEQLPRNWTSRVTYVHLFSGYEPVDEWWTKSKLNWSRFSAFRTWHFQHNTWSTHVVSGSTSVPGWSL